MNLRDANIEIVDFTKLLSTTGEQLVPAKRCGKREL